VNPNNLVERLCKEAVRIVVPHILFERKRQASKIIERLDFLRLNAGLIKLLLVKRDRGINTFSDLLQTFSLKGFESFSWQCFKLVVPDHGLSPYAFGEKMLFKL
jgi:hypothetical protein